MPLTNMERYMLQERIEIIKIHHKDGENLAETVRKTGTFLGRREAPCRTAIKKLVEKFELLGQVGDVKNESRARRSRTDENIAAVAESVEESLDSEEDLSIPRRSLELGCFTASRSLCGNGNRDCVDWIAKKFKKRPEQELLTSRSLAEH